MTDYTFSGFDEFLSRSIDDIPQLTLDSGGPQTTQIRYDSSATTGIIGDTFKMGGVELNGKDNTIVLNDATLHVNDSNTGTSVQASSGNITYFDNQGNLVVQEGTLPRGATGIRIVDKNGLGVAQFGRNADGTTTLKIAKDGFEAATATNDQLIFNSSQDVFKIALSGSVIHQGTSILAGTTDTVTIPHLLGIIPGFQVYARAPNYLYDWGGTLVGRTILPITYVLTGSVLIYLTARVDATNLYIDFINVSSSTQDLSAYSWTFNYYILQETATTS